MLFAARATTAAEPYVVPPSRKFDGNDGSWSTFRISVGTPAQDFRVLPSTKGGVTQLIIPEGCKPGIDPSNCAQLRGAEIFNTAQNIGFQVNVSSSWSTIGQFGVTLEEALGYKADAIFGFDTVALGPAADSRSLSMDKQIVAGVAEFDYFLGYLPLGHAKQSFGSLSQPIESLLYQLRASERIPSLSYAYTAGAKYRSKSVFGNLILGGYDSTRFTPPTNNFTFPFSLDASKLLTVGVDSITATNTLQGTFSLSSGIHFSVIDSTVPHLWLPRAICDEFEKAFGLTYHPETDLYLVNDTIHQQLISKNPTVTIKLLNSAADTASNYTNIQLQYGAFDLQASYPYFKNATNYFPIRRAANDTQYALGRTLLQEAYIIVDYERAKFTVAQAIFPDPLPAAKIVTITSKINSDSKTDSKGSGIGTGAIVGIAVGIALLLFLAIFAFFFFFRKRRSKKQAYELANTPVCDSGSTRYLNNATPMKSSGPSELSGTPLTELASPAVPHFPTDQKGLVSINNTPQELHAESRTPITPRWEEVQMPLQLPRNAQRSAHEMDGESNGTRSISRAASEDGYGNNDSGLRSAVSPMTGHFNQSGNPHFR
ncbi:aspartic peptidase domain-containing protein [Phaeosphaeriaceae sp. PMI808]|nr:aspartic peptidase domain-containing protein [Phaeosphaeriaceae sp. PMI808]